MAKYICRICQYVYSEKVEGTPFEDLPMDWVCPVCGAAKSEFDPLDDAPEPPGAASAGPSPGPDASSPARPAEPPADLVRPRRGIDDFRRASDELETHMADIHRMALTGESIVEPMRTRKPVVSWDDILIRGAQLASLPLNREEPVDAMTIIGPRAKRPLVVSMPVIVSHMSYGALSKEAHFALARGSAAAGTASSSGEGGLVPEPVSYTHLTLPTKRIV